MKFLSHAYRFISNFLFLALVYYSLNFMEKYPQRATLAILVLVYAAMRAATALRSFYFFQRIERLEFEARRLAGLTGEGPAALSQRKQIVTDVTASASCRRDQFLYRPAVSGDDRAAVHLEDRDELRPCSVSGAVEPVRRPRVKQGIRASRASLPDLHQMLQRAAAAMRGIAGAAAGRPADACRDAVCRAASAA